MTTPNGPDPTDVYKQYLTAIAGMSTDWPASQTAIVLNETTYTPATLAAKLQAEFAPLKAAADARLALASALAARAKALPEAAQFITAFYSVLPQYLPAGSADVTKFGSKAKKARTPLTVEKKAAANAKRAATRAARHIMGKKQRAAIQATPAPAPATTTKTGP